MFSTLLAATELAQLFDALKFIGGIAVGVGTTLFTGYKAFAKLVEERSIGRKKVKELETQLAEHEKKLMVFENFMATNGEYREKFLAAHAEYKEITRSMREDINNMRTSIYSLLTGSYRKSSTGNDQENGR